MEKTYKGYSVNGITLLNPEVLTVSYYDDYTFMGKYGMPAPTAYDYKYDNLYGYGKRYEGEAQSLLTGTLTAQLNGTDTVSYLPAIMYYDYRGRLIQSKAATHLEEGIDKEYMVYDFTGKPVKHRIPKENRHRLRNIPIRTTAWTVCSTPDMTLREETVSHW